MTVKLNDEALAFARKLVKGGSVALESRAAQNGHDDIATASKNLLTLIDS